MPSFTYLALASVAASALAGAAATCAAAADGPVAALRVEEVHPWLPPFGLERVGRSQVLVIEAAEALPDGELTLMAWRGGREVARRTVALPDQSPRIARMWFEPSLEFDEARLTFRASGDASDVELTRIPVTQPPFEADAAARSEQLINPVDLQAVLPPADWLLLGPGQSGRLTVRAIQRGTERRVVTVTVWFDSAPQTVASAAATLLSGARHDIELALPAGAAERDVLRVEAADDEGRVLWSKAISTMRVARPAALPRFGAVETRLRYDPPISVRDPATGAYTSLPYAEGWSPELADVVVCLPNGSRLVFWRGASYIPFWASRHNAGLCCEWAEMLPPYPADRTDCIEPLMDKELRYGRVEVIESTAARVHVRWSYQSTDLLYKVWGDRAVEDYIFYPDGFGTRVLTLSRDPQHRYELSEVILIGPQETYPLAFVPREPVDLLFLDGEKRRIGLPASAASLGEPRDAAAAYRLRIHQDDPASVLYFTPRQRALPPVVFGPFYDREQLVTPAYWGSHWPLARGNATGSAIDERIHRTPHHTSVMSWAHEQPAPLVSRTEPTVDALGRSKVMTTERWAWLTGMTDASDEDVLARARSYANPPSVEATGARLAREGQAPERRAICLIADGELNVTVKLTPSAPCVNPVLELDDAPGELASIELDGRRLAVDEYAWDGRVLWLGGTLSQPATIALQFRAP